MHNPDQPVQELRLRSILDHLQEVVFQTDAEGLWTYLNPAWTHITGFGVEESLGVSFLDYVHPDDRERNVEAFTPLIERKKEVCHHEVRYLTATGGHCWIEVHARLTLDEHGDIVGTSGTLRDITERRAAEEAGRRLAESQGARAESDRARERVERILEGMGEGFLALDQSGHVTYANRAAESLLDVDRTEVLGRLVHEVVPHLVLPIPAALASGPQHVELVGHGDRRHLEAAVYEAEGGFSVYIQDVTDRKRAAALLQRRLDVEEALAVVSSLLALGSDQGTRDALAILGELVDVSRAYLYLLEGSTLAIAHEWRAPGLALEAGDAEDLAVDEFPWFTALLAKGAPVAISDVHDLPPEGEAEQTVLMNRQTVAALAVPIHGPGGEVEGFLGFDDTRGPRPWSPEDIRALTVAAEMVASVVARTRAEDAMRMSEERYRLATRATQDMIYAWDVATGVLSRGGSPESGLEDIIDAVGDTIAGWKQHLHPDDAARVSESLSAALSGRTRVWSAEYRLRRPGGGYAVILDRSYIVRDKDHRAVRLVGAMSDISRSRAAEDALRASRARLADAERIACLGSWDVDLNSGSTAWSPQLYKLMGRDPALGPLSHQGFLERVPEEDRPAMADALGQAVRTGEPFSLFHRVTQPDGAIRHHKILAEVQTGPDGGLHLVGVSQDVTDQRALEIQLRQSQKLEAVGLLAGGVAHDFNNVLSVVSAAAELVKAGLPEADPGATDLDEILDGVRRGASLTRQLLSFSGKRVTHPRVLDPNAVVTDLHKMLKRLMPEDVVLSVELSSHVGPILMDPGHVEQIIMNLVINARDAMSRGGRLTVETARTTVEEESRLPGQVGDAVPPGAYSRLTVADTGHGMDEATLQTIFDPFFTTKAPGKGTGLGLATVHGIVRDAGGTICVRSVPDEGTVFHVYLPEHVGEAGEAGSRVREDAEEPTGQGQTILVVDDDPVLARLARRVLEGRGYTVLEATHPEDALTIAEEHADPIDLLLSDVAMPGLTGVEVAARARELHPDLKVLYMSGHVADNIRRAGLQPTGVSLLEKPLDIPRFLRAVHEALGGT